MTGVINVCTDSLALDRGLELVRAHPQWILTAGGVPPHDVEAEGRDEQFQRFRKAALCGQLEAIGETGLDYFYHGGSAKAQKQFFIQHLHLAIECSLPVVIHCRNAFADLFDITEHEYKKGGGFYPAMVHCFTGTLEEMERIVDRGWYLSISGIVTFKNAISLRETVERVPNDRLLIETDTPYLPPRTYRGEKNEPSFIVETARCIGEIKHLSLEQVGRISVENGWNFLGKTPLSSSFSPPGPFVAEGESL